MRLKFKYKKQTLEKTERGIKNDQSRDIGNTVNTIHGTMANKAKAKYTTQPRNLNRWATQTPTNIRG
jgi:hypothetical protein